MESDRRAALWVSDVHVAHGGLDDAVSEDALDLGQMYTRF
jgi:hypothetical protein